METKLRLAVQKSGRLSEGSVALLAECGIKVGKGSKALKAPASGFPLEVFYLRDDDIPQYVADGVAHAGIVGQNVVAEKGKDVSIVEHLGFSKCRLSLAIPKQFDYSGLNFFEGRKIATSYPKIVRQFLDDNQLTATIEEISGSVEIAPGIGLADGICDIVSTGSTLLMNGLKEVATVMKSEALLIANSDLPDEITALLEKLVFRIQSVKSAQNSKYILLNAPNNRVDDIIALLPGMKSPTVLPLATEGWSSVHSAVREDDFWEIIDQLKDMGAEGVLVVPIEKMIV